ncbi:hypothetical protein N7462_011674 [Penicillium macrosclerotiorum]|uniref:uncharacterized protein n=1 Tax=Penicillium macrosclerotiorum TaxID=303699 RepID=UPI0025476DD1|nr:uncharacterized protein N7462_011674 [Penicillium macrosclerotiorum]KAJ5662748.1 hypothetical protein N7462_011674 [Penicillium macrosclerotiorum]
MQEYMRFPVRNFLEDDVLGETAQSQRRRKQLSNQDLKEEERVPLPFEGDKVPNAVKSYPPLAWTLIWQGTYSNLYGYYVPDTMRRWGYIMWNKSRLEETGALEVLARQWEEEWGARTRETPFFTRHSSNVMQ